MSEAQLFSTMTFSEIYERVLVTPLFRPFATELISRLNPAHGDSLLDVACGTGIAARIGREKLGPAARMPAWMPRRQCSPSRAMRTRRSTGATATRHNFLCVMASGSRC